MNTVDEAAAAVEAGARMLSVSEAADRMGVGETTLYGLLSSGCLRSVKLGRRRLIPSSAIEECIDRLIAEGADQ